MFVIGRIVNTHGINGEVKVKQITDFMERFDVGATVFVRDEQDKEISLTIDQSRRHKQHILLHFDGYRTIESVEKFKGLFLMIKKEQQTPLEQNEYYYHEIIGCTVYTNCGNKLGVIDSILSPGANDVWVVKNSEQGKEFLIPFIEDVVKKVDVNKKLVMIELMEGLLD